MDINRVIKKTEDTFCLEEGEIYSRKKDIYISRPRMIAMHLLKKIYSLHDTQIEKIFSKSSGCARNAMRRVQAMLETEPKIKKIINGLEKELTKI